MSAIYGLKYSDDRSVTSTELESMKTALIPHGPDGAHVWKKGSVGLGHLLMRNTPEDEFIPSQLASNDGQCVLVADARIDNRTELAHQLSISVATARGMSDSDFIARSYDKWGFGCAKYLVGVYTFALWDAREQKLLLVNSPMGDRPLFYVHSENFFAFATMPKGLFALPFVERCIDMEHLADFMAIAQQDFGDTIYKGVKRLPAGHQLIAFRQKVTQTRYWQPDLTHKLQLARDEDYVEAFNELFERVIADNLRSVSPVGVMMSGGLDSSSVAAVAASQLKQQGKILEAFTEVPGIGFDCTVPKDRYADESHLVNAVARLNEAIIPNFIRTDGQFFLNEINKSSYIAIEFPVINGSNSVWWTAALQHAKNKGTNVLLTGFPGNLTISWNGSGLLSHLFRSGHYLKCWQEAQAISSLTAGASTLRMIFSQAIMPTLPDAVWNQIQTLRGNTSSNFPPWQSYSLIRPEFALSQRLKERARENGVNFNYRLKSNTAQVRYAKCMQMSPIADVLFCGYQAQYGVEIRNPTNDSRLVQFCLTIPEEQYLRKGNDRWLIRRAMVGKLPPEILVNTQRGLQAADWFERYRGAQCVLWREMGYFERSSLVNSVLDIKRMRSLIESISGIQNATNEINAEYRVVLESGLLMGRFLRWFECGE